MKTLWYIAKKDLLQVIKDRNALILLLVVPLALITVVGFALGNLYGDGSSQIKIKVALSNHDAGIGNTITRSLKVDTKDLLITVSQYSDTAQVTDRVDASNDAADVGIVIPAGASQAILDAGQSASTTKNLIQFYTLPNATGTSVTIVRNIINNVVQEQRIASVSARQVHQVCGLPGNTCAPRTINDAAISGAVVKASQTSDQAIVSQTVGHATKASAFDQVVPGYAIFFSLFGLNAVAATILQEQEDGTFRRLLIAPIQKYALLGGKMLAQFLLTLAQLTILFAIGYFAFKMHIPSWPTIILLLIATSFAATGLGILLVSVIKSRRQINPVVSLVTLITSAIGGAWWPLYTEPTWMQQLAKVGITAWAMEGLNGSMLFGKGLSGVLPDILGLLIYGGICFVIALRLFSFQPKTVVA
ncbi:ABC transporter permease [Dictyobacter aurantiacus]|uniref:ABC transmembrane type-2 domain-containing protein n=1 Tax=Dictyobacter aurantiacus TaxID=1936993 RepID=A0A401ZP91_9CHLR|nr:ABC transporter permease [Dictyobacter aurantiacus]GCE08673.1 hypothetical protein KDAU_60020 [Dictyobacter aurantiacus]